MLFDYFIVTMAEGLGLEGPARLYQHPAKTVTFSPLSEQGALAALSLGFSPPINLPVRRMDEDGYFTSWWILEGETAAPISQIRLFLFSQKLRGNKGFIERFFEPGVPFRHPFHVPTISFCHD